MAAKKKTTRKKASRTPNYPLLTLDEYAALSPQEKIKFIEVLKSEPSKPNPNLAHISKEAPQLIAKAMETYRDHFGMRGHLTRSSMAAHIGILIVGTIAMLILGCLKVLDGAAVVAVLGPLYTYVLVNLRYLTGWKMVGDSSSDS